MRDGRRRVCFEMGKAVCANLGEADGSMIFSVAKEADLQIICAGNEPRCAA